MKNTKILIFSLFACMLFIVPFFVNGEEKENNTTEADNKVTVHIFKREGCQYCAAALEFFNSLLKDKEYGKYFELVKYDIVTESESSKLFDELEEYLEETIDGVPYIVIGEERFPGYIESWNEDIKSAIKELYETPVEERVDIVSNVINNVEKPDKSNTVVDLIVSAGIVGVVALLIYTRKKASLKK